MILDSLLAWSVNQNLAQVVGSYVSTNIIDLHIAAPPGVPILAANQGARDIGIGDDPAMKILVQVTTAFTSGGAATLAVSLQGAPDNGSGAPAGFTTWYTSPALGLGAGYPAPGISIVGTRLLDMDMPRPPAGQPMPRFLQLSYAVAGATTTAGTVSAFLVLDRHDQPYNGLGTALGNNAILGGYIPGIVIAN